MNNRKTRAAVGAEKQRQFEDEAQREYIGKLTKTIREQGRIIRLIAMGAAALEEECERLRKFDDYVPF